MKKDKAPPAASVKTIQLADFMKPFQVTSTIGKNTYSRSHQVCVESDGQAPKSMIIQEFYPDPKVPNLPSNPFVKTCRILTDLSRSFAKAHVPNFWTYTHPDGTGYILFGADYASRLDEETHWGDSAWERLSQIWNIALALDILARSNVLLNQVDSTNILCPEGSPVLFWNFSEAVYADERGPEQSASNQARQADTASLARLMYYAITREQLLPADLEQADFIDNQLTTNVIALCDELTAPDLELLLKIFRKSLGFEEAYNDISEMAQDLELLLDQLSVSKPVHDGNQDVELAAADFLDRNPLYRYIHSKKGENTLNVVLIGEAPIRKAFFNTIFSSAQILDTQMRIHVIAADADKFYDECIASAPLLSQTARITHIPTRTDTTNELDQRVTGGMVLADLTFETTAAIPTPQQLHKLDPSCVLILDTYTKEMGRLAQKLANRTSQPLLIGIGNHKSLECSGIGKSRAVDLRFFSRNGSCVDIRSLEDTAIYRKALAIHTFYEKENDQRVARETILKNFENSYNRGSSLRNALSIPYKLHACGLADMPDASRLFFDRVLSAADNQALLSRLIWMERRSWQAFLITNGYQLPPEEEKVAFIRAHNFTHQDKQNKRHLCLCSNRDDGVPLPLSRWTLEDWDKRDISELDLLDQLSVTLHRTFADEVKTNTTSRLSAALNHLEGKLCPNNASLYQECCITLNHLLDNETNSHLAWKQVYTKLVSKLPGDGTVNTLNDLAGMVIKRNQYRDFKQSDLSTIQAIPYLLLDQPIRRVYKLYSDHLWDNVASSVFIEPEELTVITDSSIDSDQFACFERFLHERRNLDIQLQQISLKQLHAVKPDGVLDITGATAHQILDAQQHPILSKLPVIEYKNGKLVNPDRKYSQIQFYNRTRSLTVSEMLSLTGATMLSDQEDIPMLGMDKYDQLWKIAQKYPNYNNACSVLAEGVADAKSVYRDSTQWVTYLSKADADRCGLLELLNTLQKENVIRPLKWGALSGATAVIASEPLMQHNLNTALDKAVSSIKQDTGTSRCTFSVRTKPDFNTRGIFSCEISRNGQSFSTIYKARLWETDLPEFTADQNGLSALLNQLDSVSIIRPFKWGNNGHTTRIEATDPYCQHSLNRLLDHYVAPKTNQSDHKLMFSRDEHDHQKAAVSLVNTSLKYSRKNISGNQYLLPQKSNGRISAMEFMDLLTDLRKEGIITTADGSVPFTQCAPAPNASYDIEFEYADIACRDCLTKEGNVLEAFAYHTIRKMNLFDDVKLSVTIQWDKLGVDARDTTNEIDIICTKGVKSYFISCKKRPKIGQDHLTEIRYEADRFGVDSTPILLTTARENDDPVQIQHNRAKRMGIQIISLQDFTPELGTPQDSAKVLTERLTAIVSGNSSV